MTISDQLSSTEKKAAYGLAAIFALRMAGLFLILPVFAIYGASLSGADSFTIGLAIGVYGITQAFLHIPLGYAADYFGRKKVITLGLILFAIGSLIAAEASSIYLVIFARIMQGCGAVSAAITALAADLTREQQRSKIMAMIGASIGLVFALSLILAPLLYSLIGMPGIFYLIAVLSLLAIVMLYRYVPPELAIVKSEKINFGQILIHPALWRLNFGVFVLHMAQTAIWVVIPTLLINANLPVRQHGWIYLGTLVLSFAFMVPLIIRAEKRQKNKQTYILSIAFLAVVMIVFTMMTANLISLILFLCGFFIAFNLLEALQPSLISRYAGQSWRARAMGLYNTLQSLGLFCGGFFGGFLVKHYGANYLFFLIFILILLWLLISFQMPQLPERISSSR